MKFNQLGPMEKNLIALNNESLFKKLLLCTREKFSGVEKKSLQQV